MRTRSLETNLPAERTHPLNDAVLSSRHGPARISPADGPAAARSLSSNGESPTLAQQFRRGEVAGQLARPLRATLPLPVPNPDTITTAPDTPFIGRITITSLFKFSLTTGNQDANVFLVLDPPPTDS